MKFTATEALKNIQAELGNTQKLSDRTITETLETLMKVMATDETELVDFVKGILPVIKTANTNVIKDQTDFVKDWTLKNPKKDEQKKDEMKKDEQPNDLAAQLEALLDKKLSPLQQELEGYRAERTTESIFTQAQNAFLADNKLDFSNERVKMIKDRVFTTVKSKVGKDSKVEEVSAAMKAEFEDLVKLTGINDPYIPAEQSGGAGGTDAAQFAAANKILQDSGKLPTAEAAKTN